MHQTEQTEFVGIKRGLSRRVQIVIIAALAVIVLLVLVFKFALGPSDGANSPATPSAGTETPASFRPTADQLSNLTIVKVEKQEFRTEVVADGKIASNEETTTPVFSPYSGRVSRLIAKPGDVVRRGSPLMMVESSDLIQARNNLIAAAAAVKSAHGASQSHLAGAQAILENARDQMRILGTSDAEIEAIEKDPNPKNMNMGAYVLAPISGTVIQRRVGLGQFVVNVAGGATEPAYMISNLSTVWLVANVHEDNAPLIRRGAEVEVRLMALPDKVFKARLSYVASVVDPVTHRLAVRAELPNPQGLLKPEMFASMTILGDDVSTAVGMPEEGVIFEGDSARVWVMQQDGSLALRAIRAGRHSHGMIEVLSGLEAGDKVVTRGSLFIDRAAKSD